MIPAALLMASQLLTGMIAEHQTASVYFLPGGTVLCERLFQNSGDYAGLFGKGVISHLVLWPWLV